MAFKDSHDVNASNSIFTDVQGDQNNYYVDHDNPDSTTKLLEHLSTPSASFDSAERYPAAECLPGTRDAVIAQIMETLSNPTRSDPALCWLYGSQGSGKSSLAQSIAEKLSDQGDLAASFFFSRSKAERNDFKHFIPTIAHQLTLSVPSLKSAITSALHNNSSILQKAPRYQLKKLITDPIRMINTPMAIVVDAIDECNDERLAAQIIFNISRAQTGSPLPLRFLVTSRSKPHRDIVAKIISLDAFDPYDDICRLFRHAFENIRERHSTFRHIALSWPSCRVIETLVQQSSAQFSSATTLLNRIEGMNDTEMEEYMEELDPLVTIAVMGTSGSGMTTFINLLSGSDLPVGNGLESCTTDVQVAEPFYLGDRKVLLIDTPGFDHTMKSDKEVLDSIATYLSATYKKKPGMPLAGVIYMHPISDFRIGGTSRRNWRMFTALCGNEALKNVLFVTTMWNQVSHEIGEAREAKLRDSDVIFKPVLGEWGGLLRHDNTLDSAQAIVHQLVGNHPVALHIQRELVDMGKGLFDTDAGIEFSEELVELGRRHEKELQKVTVEMQAALKAQDKEMRKGFQMQRPLPGTDHESNLDSISVEALEALGFPLGSHFLIRSKITGTMLHSSWHSIADGTPLSIWDMDDDPVHTTHKAFFIDSTGSLCHQASGSVVDVVDNTLVLRHRRAVTQPYPNPWSHRPAQFSYCKSTSLLEVKFWSDPSLPASASPLYLNQAWCNKRFLVTTNSINDHRTRMYSEFASWAPKTSLGSLSTFDQPLVVPRWQQVLVEEKSNCDKENRSLWDIVPL